MKQTTLKNKDAWLEARMGRITGTSAGSLLSKRDKKPLKGFYDILADRVSLPETDENRMDRGLRLEEEAINRFAQETGKKVKWLENTIYYRDDEPNIAYSPDGDVENEPADIEVKCRDRAYHIEAILTGEIPKTYMDQIIQGFVVNDEMETRYMVFYDPRCVRDFFYIEVKREDYEEDIQLALEEQREVLKQIEELETKILNF